jgi:phage shock protein PspC (stress-responsive transcriptional regulator)
LIILITFFNADIGIILFIVWSFYKEWTQKYEAQHKL